MLKRNDSTAGIEEYNARYVNLMNQNEAKPYGSVPPRQNFTLLNSHETSNLVSTLMELLNLSRDLESLKMELAICSEFNLMDAFSIFDEEGSGSCSPEQFVEKLVFIGAAVPERRYIDIFFKRYNKKNDGRLKYSEFMNAICPLNESYTAMVIQRKPKGKFKTSKHPISLWQGETYSKFVGVLECLLKTESAAQDMVSRLSARKDFSPEKAFHTLAASQACEESVK